MILKASLTFFTAGWLAAALLIAPSASAVAQGRSAISTELSAQQQKNAAPAARRAQPRAAPQRTAPRVAAPRRAAPRTATQARTAPRTVTRTRTAPRTVTRTRTTPRTVTRSKTTPRVGTTRTTKVITRTRFRGLPARGAGRAVINGRNYSVWRSGYRIRRGGGWRTFVALSTLGALAFGATQYYPYAYVSAPQPYCDGLTEDGCQLSWKNVQTVEGDVISQCVAYCPWQ